MPEMKDLIAIFKAETEEHLTKLDNGLVELEKQPDNIELASTLNREVHTLKGAARVFGFYNIQDIAHRIEDIFEEVAGKRAVFNSSMAEGIFKGLDAIRAILEKIVQEKKIDAEVDVDASDICRELEECIFEAQAVRTRRKRERGPKREKETAETQAKDGQEKGDHEREQEGRKAPDKVVGRTSEAVVPHLSAQTEEYIRVPMSRVDKLLYLVGEVVINKMKASAMSAQAKRLSKLSREAQKSILSLSEAVRKEFSPETEK